MRRIPARIILSRGRLRPVAALFALLTAAMLWGLVPGSAGSSPSPEASPGKLSLTLGTTSDADNLNPFIGYSGTSYEIFHLNYDFLVGYATDLSPRPELATSWETSPDGKVWTFHLREGVVWQDGRPFTSADVVFTYMFIIDNGLTAFTSYTNSITRVVAVDDLTVRMYCSKPKANMLRLWIPILPKHIWEDVPGDRAGVDWAVEPPIVGTGPFQTIKVKKGEYIKLEKNPRYWIAGKPTVDEIVMSVYENRDTMTQDLKTGALDYATDIPPAQFKALDAETSLTTHAANIRYFDEVCMNCYDSPDSLGNPVLRDERFRRAISWAVDKQKIVDFSYGGYARVGQGIIAPEVPSYAWTPAPEQVFGFDLDKARSLLDTAGYSDTDGDGVREHDGKPITLRLWARSDDVASQNSGKLIAGWFEEIGLKIVFQTLDSGAISDALYNYKGDTYAPDYDLYIWGWGQYVDPDYILNVYTTGQIAGWNDPCWSDERYDELYARQAQTIDPAARKPLIDEMVSMFYDSAPYIVTDYEQQLEAYNTSRWQGWTQAPEGGPVAFVNDNIDTYLNLRPVAAARADDSSSTTWVYALVGAIAVVAVLAALLLSRRRRGRKVEE
jgi:peptide/nickel transport system substrate-binding protein